MLKALGEYDQKMLVGAAGDVMKPRDVLEEELQKPDHLAVAKDGSPMTLSRQDGLYLFVVNDAGQVCYAAQKFDVSFTGQEHETVKHPMLVAGAAARIGGEIRFHPDEERWSINNDSGRYSSIWGEAPYAVTDTDQRRTKIGSRSERNLLAAVELIKTYGCNEELVPDFILFAAGR